MKTKTEIEDEIKRLSDYWDRGDDFENGFVAALSWVLRD